MNQRNVAMNSTKTPKILVFKVRPVTDNGTPLRLFDFVLLEITGNIKLTCLHAALAVPHLLTVDPYVEDVTHHAVKA